MDVLPARHCLPETSGDIREEDDALRDEGIHQVSQGGDSKPLCSSAQGAKLEGL